MWEHFVAAGRPDEAFVCRRVIEKLGGSVVIATRDEDIRDHVDFWWRRPDGAVVGIDVKGMRKRSRYDPRPDNDITWIEFQNVLGEKGWLYGKAMYFAFRRIGHIVFVRRDVLADYGERLIAGKPIETRRPAICGIPYTRAAWGRNDITTMVSLDEVERLSEFIIEDK